MAAAAVAAALAVAAVLVKLTPDVYSRTETMGLDDAAAARFNRDVFNGVANVLLDKSGGTRLDMELTEAMVNARLARFVDEEVRSGRPVPPAARDLRIGFEPGALVLATRLGSGATAVVVTQRLALEATADGRLVVRPDGTRAGGLPLPGVALDALVQMARALTARDDPAADDEKSIDLWRAVVEGLDGKPVPLGKGKKRIVLERLEIERGVLKAQGRRGEKVVGR